MRSAGGGPTSLDPDALCCSTPRVLAAPGEGARGGCRRDPLLPHPHWQAGKLSLTQEDPCFSLLCGLLGGASHAESLLHLQKSKRERVQGCHFDLSVEQSQLIVSTTLVPCEFVRLLLMDSAQSLLHKHPPARLHAPQLQGCD